jgi:transposase
LEAHEHWLLELIEREKDLTLAQVVERLDRDLGVKTSDSSVDRFYRRHGITFKKKSARRRAGSAGRGGGPG